MSEPSAARILVVDNDERVGADIAEICTFWGWQVRVIQGAPTELVQRAHGAALEFQPHVAIVDVRLLDDYEDDRSGLLALENLRSARCILYSGYLTLDIMRTAQRMYDHIEEVIGKNEPPDMLASAIRQAVSKSSAHHSHHQIEWRSQRPLRRIQASPLGEAGMVTQEMIEDLLCRLFPKARSLAIDAINRTPMASGLTARTDSLVLKITRDNLEPVVLRLASANRIEDEVQRYDAHIEERLAGRFYAQMIAQTAFWQIGGAVYSFLGAAQVELPMFSAFYAQKEVPAEIVAPLRDFFTTTWHRHYLQAAPLDAPSLFAAYDQALKLGDKLQSLASEPLLSTLPFDPVAWVQQNAAASQIASARQAITHGDLHGDNLFVDADHAWVIDFERCGPGPILRDFVELEVDILTRLMQMDDGPTPLYDHLLHVLAGQSHPQQVLICPEEIAKVAELYKAFCVIIHLRKLAYDVTKFDDMREYLWGILLDALFAAFLAAKAPARRLRTLKVASAFGLALKG